MGAILEAGWRLFQGSGREGAGTPALDRGPAVGADQAPGGRSWAGQKRVMAQAEGSKRSARGWDRASDTLPKFIPTMA